MTEETVVPVAKKARKKGLKRGWLGRTEDMFSITGTFVKGFVKLEGLIAGERPMWKAPFFATLEGRHEELQGKVIGKDGKGALKYLTYVVRTKFDDAKDLLGDVEAQMEYGFLKEPETLKTMLDTLGFTEYWSRAVKGNQVAMGSLLIRFTENVGVYKDSLLGIDVPAEDLDDLQGLRDGLREGNLAQESTKSISKLDTVERVELCNEFYREVMAIAKVVNRILKKQAKLKRSVAPEVFNYALALRNLHVQRVQAKKRGE